MYNKYIIYEENYLFSFKYRRDIYDKNKKNNVMKHNIPISTNKITINIKKKYIDYLDKIYLDSFQIEQEILFHLLLLFGLFAILD